MALSQAVANVYKLALLNAVHLTSHTYKIALFKATASIVGTFGAATTSYTEMGADEVPNGSGYTTGGATLTGRTAALVSGAGVLDWADPTWAASTITSRGALIYNDSLAGKDALFVLDFGSDIASTNDLFTVDLPAQGAGTSLFRLP
jgi:hypothetical protein